jgi:hypothetical protein
MTKKKYENARDAVRALNRFARGSARPRQGERESNFKRDCQIARSLYADPNILGFGVGLKVASGKSVPSEFSLIFFVRRKLQKSRLRNLVSIPKHLHLHTSDLRVQTDIQVWGAPPVSHGLVTAGASIGDIMGNSGTMTLCALDSSTQKPVILGCSHVLAACGQDHVGDDVESPSNVGVPPGQNRVGKLLRFTTIDPSSLNNAIDAAIATPVSGVTLSNNLPGIGIPDGVRDLTLEGGAVVNQVSVQRAGVASGLQGGTIRNIHVSTLITFTSLPGDASVNFVELVQYDAVSNAGDSGAAVVDTTPSNNIVGMHIAGTSDGSSSFFTHIQWILDRMQVSYSASP